MNSILQVDVDSDKFLAISKRNLARNLSIRLPYTNTDLLTVAGWTNSKAQALPNHRPQAVIAHTVFKVTKMEATAPTVFRERPKRPPARYVAPEPSVAPAARAVPAKDAPTLVALSSTPKVVGTFEIRGGGNVDSSFYVDQYMAEAAFEMLKANAIKAEKEVWLVNGGF